MNTFEKSQAAKMLACYIAPEEIQKGNDSEKISMTKKDFKEEHENLIKVLESPSKEDDKEEIKEQEKEAKDYGVELEKADTFEKSQSAKLLACYLSEDLEKGHPVGYINAHGKQKQADGSYKYIGKNKENFSTEASSHTLALDRIKPGHYVCRNNHFSLKKLPEGWQALREVDNSPYFEHPFKTLTELKIAVENMLQEEHMFNDNN